MSEHGNKTYCKTHVQEVASDSFIPTFDRDTILQMARLVFLKIALGIRYIASEDFPNGTQDADSQASHPTTRTPHAPLQQQRCISHHPNNSA